MADDHYTPMSVIQYVLDRLRTGPPKDGEPSWSPEDGVGHIPKSEKPTAEGQSIPSSVDPQAPSNFHFHGDDAVGAKKPTEPITLRCMNCDETMEFDPVRGPPRLNWLSRKFNHGGHYCGVINSIRNCCSTPRYYEDSIGGRGP